MNCIQIAHEDFYNPHNRKILEDAAKRMENKNGVLVKTMAELESTENE